MNAHRNLGRNAIIAVLGTLLGIGIANAQPGTGPFAAFPTQSAKDGRFIGFACVGIGSFQMPVSIAMAAPPATATFDLDIFDGDTDQADGSAKKHWDMGSRQLMYSLYADPWRTGSTAPADLIGSWAGNASNPTSGPLWTSSSAMMPDNAWWNVTVATSEIARAPSGNYFYNLVIALDGTCGADEIVESNLKIAVSDPVTFRTGQVGLVAGFRQIFNDGPILYPGIFPPPGGFLAAPTTYDGTFELYFTLPGGETDLCLFDGDFDFGTDSTAGHPSGVSLDACADEDDANSAANYSGFPFETSGANAEGAQGKGVPPEDNRYDAFRRGELGDPNRIGCVRYEVTDPEGHTYYNDNPSGSFEWEQFMITSLTSAHYAEADWVAGSAMLPAGEWKVRIIGLDLANLSFWYGDTCATRPARAPELGEDPDDVPRMAACPDESVLLLGDFVWEDTENPGTLDAGEAGIAGVLMELVRPSDGEVLATMRTGDSTSPNWDACVAKHSGSDMTGLSCFGADASGQYEIRIAASNFGPDQPLSGKVSTTGGESSLRSLSTGNSINAPGFGYQDLGFAPIEEGEEDTGKRP